jgi:nucleoside-diphosphate-sugar epimerase
MRVAVTGGNGFVGRHVLAALRARGHDAVGLVRSEKAVRVVQDAGGVAYRIAELGGESLPDALRGSQAVVHTAQIGAERGEATYEAVNVGGTRAVAEAAGRAGVRRLVFLSGLGVAHYGLARRTTNRYFLSKLAAELLLYSSGLEVAVLRPSYILGPGEAFLPAILQAMDAGEVEIPGDGAYRMQPIAVSDACAVVVALLEGVRRDRPTVLELVGPEPISFLDLLRRVAKRSGATREPSPLRIRSTPIDEAERQAAAGGYQGMSADELDCLLCDEVGDHGPLEALLGRPLVGLDGAIAAALGAAVGA